MRDLVKIYQQQLKASDLKTTPAHLRCLERAVLICSGGELLEEPFDIDLLRTLTDRKGILVRLVNVITYRSQTHRPLNADALAVYRTEDFPPWTHPRNYGEQSKRLLGAYLKKKGIIKS